MNLSGTSVSEAIRFYKLDPEHDLLVLVDDYTLANQVDTHVCELQLGLAAFDDLKNEHGHKLYVQWRDARAD